MLAGCSKMQHFNQSAGRVSTVMAPKCAGMERLDAATRPCHARERDVLIGGISLGLWWSGQLRRRERVARCVCPHYVAQGRPTTSVQWGAWSGGGGMAAGDAGIIQRMERLGVGVISPQQGLAVLRL